MSESDPLIDSGGSYDVRVAGVGDSQSTHPKILDAGRRPQLDVVTGVMMDTGHGQHGVVLNLTLSEPGCVVGDDNNNGRPVPMGLIVLLVA